MSKLKNKCKTQQSHRHTTQDVSERRETQPLRTTAEAVLTNGETEAVLAAPQVEKPERRSGCIQ